MEKTQNKIIYIGNFRPSFSTENDIKSAFEKLGWEVYPVQEDEMNEGTIEEICKIEQDYKFILYTRTWARTDSLFRKLLKRTNKPTVSFHLDLYLGLSRGIELQNDSFFMSDFVFSADCGNQEEFKRLGINHIGVPPAINEDGCFLGKKENKYDVIFVGSEKYHTEWSYRPYLIRWLRENYGERFKMLPDGKAIRGKDLNDLYNSAKVVIGDATYSSNYWSDRVPETLGRGGFLIHPYIEGIEKEFKLWKDFVPYNYGDMVQLKMLIDYYLENPKERNKIRLHGMKTVKAKHTYTHRVKFILKYLGYAKN